MGTTLKTADIGTALTKKGFKKEDNDHHFFIYYNNGKKTDISTKTSHSHKEIGDPLVGLMAKSLHLTKAEFVRLIQCTLDGETYKKLLVDRGKLK